MRAGLGGLEDKMLPLAQFTSAVGEVAADVTGIHRILVRKGCPGDQNRLGWHYQSTSQSARLVRVW